MCAGRLRERLSLRLTLCSTAPPRSLKTTAQFAPSSNRKPWTAAMEGEQGWEGGWQEECVRACSVVGAGAYACECH